MRRLLTDKRCISVIIGVAFYCFLSTIIVRVVRIEVKLRSLEYVTIKLLLTVIPTR